MIKNYKKLLSSKEYWMNTFFLLYPFFIVSFLAYISENYNLILFILFKASIFNFVIFSSVLMAGSVISNISIKKNILRIAYFIQFICIFLFVYHFALYNQLLGLPSIYALTDTNFHEAYEFFETNFKLNHLIISSILSFPMIYCAIKPFNLPIHDSTSKWLFSMMPLTVFGAVIYLTISVDGREYWTKYNPLIAIPHYVSLAVKEKYKINYLYSKAPSINNIKVRNDGDKTTHILIISESINRNHMSLYGYPRVTTPKLSGMADSLFILKDPCSSRNTTIPSLKEMLTFASREDASNLFKAPNLIQVMHAAGFETYWLSNQQEIGIYDSFVSFFSKSSDHKTFVDRRGWQEGMSLDEKLFPPLENTLKDGVKKKFIIIHLIGAHINYYWRYPKEYEVFNDTKETIKTSNSSILSPSAMKRYNQYDNAILYNDYVVSHIIKMQNSLEPVTVTYISDHGESVGEKNGFFGHVENLPYRAINEIPVFFWFSEPSKKHITHKIEHLSQNLAVPFQSDQLIHSLLDLYGVEYPLIDYKHSLFDAGFRPKSRYCDNLHIPSSIQSSLN